MNLLSVSLAFLLIFFVDKSLAQNEFVPGYIINSKHDTLFGEMRLNLKNEAECFSKISFKEKTNGSIKTYQPHRIDGFGIEGNHYHSVKLDNHWVFMLVHCQGKIGLFEYKPPAFSGNEKLKSDYYVMKGGFENLQELAIDNKLKKHIKALVSDDKPLWKDFEKNEFNFGVLVNLISEYNDRNK